MLDKVAHSKQSWNEYCPILLLTNPYTREVDHDDGIIGKTADRAEDTSGGRALEQRCAGLMVIEESFDSMTGTAHVEFQVRRCVQCGEVIDPVILQNRRAQSGYDLGRSEKERLLVR